MTSHRLTLTGALAAAAYLIGLLLDLQELRLLVKTIPALCLAAWVWPQGDRLIAWGLLFGALGDLCLALPAAFLPGMVAFAIGHALYVRAFWHWRGTLSPGEAVPVVLYLGVALNLMLPGTGALQIPVAVYITIIGAMIWRAAVVAEDRQAAFAARWAALGGALLFGFSDTLIGLNRFVTPLPGAEYPIILLYWGGQWLIAWAANARGKAH